MSNVSSIPQNQNRSTSISSFIATNCKFNTFPFQICDLSNLVSVDLSFNKIKGVPDQILNCKNLKTMILTNNHIETISAKLFQINLEYLLVQNNNISFLPLIQKNETNSFILKIFDLTNNNLSVIEEDVFSNINVERLFLSFNKIEVFPKLSPMIEQLIISNNKLNNISHLETISNYDQFTFLDVSHNQLEGI